MDFLLELKKKISTKKAKIGVVGIGYVGGALANASYSAGFETIGFDIDKEKIERINKLNIPGYYASDNFSLLNSCDIICICVPTPIREDNSPNLDFLQKAFEKVLTYLRFGQLLTVESSVVPGTTRKLLISQIHKPLEIGKIYLLLIRLKGLIRATASLK